MKKAVIMDIQRYSIHDGPGIRTTVFFKGCNMRCQWCHNPESQYAAPEMLFYEKNCVSCMACVSHCHRNAHRMENGKHWVDLQQCRDCPNMEACSENCPTGAMRKCGQEMTADEVLQKILVDKSFYGKEGGMTCSGGEALLQDEFLMELLPLCKEQGISTCVDTTLNVEWARIEKLLPWIDLFLVDIKFMDKEQHLQYAGTDGELTLHNLVRLSERKKDVVIRMPLVPGINDTPGEARLRVELLEKLNNVIRIDYFVVSNHAREKYSALQRPFQRFHSVEEKEKVVEEMRKRIVGDI